MAADRVGKEAQRLHAVVALDILDTPPEERFDRVTRLAAQLLAVPVALITLVDDSREWTKSAFGLHRPELPRESSFCGYTIAGPGLLEVPDAGLDRRFAGNQLVRADPGIRFYAGRPLRTSDGHAVGALCVMDHQPRRLTSEERSLLTALGAWAEAELQAVQLPRLLAAQSASDRRLRQILDYMVDAVLIVEPEGIVRSSNSAGERLFGYPAEQLSGRPLAELVTDLRPADVPGAGRRSEDAGRQPTGPVERSGRTAAGQQLPVEITVTWLRDSAFTGYIAVLRDLRPREGSQGALRRLQRLNDLILASASEGILSVDRAGRITSANLSAARLLRYRTPELVGADLHRLVHHSRADGSPYPAAECPLSETLGTGRTLRITDETYWRRDGTSVPVELASAPIYEGDVIVGAVETFVDISERIAVDKMKDEFLSLVSHELRTPLTSIRGSLGLLAGGVFGPLGEEPTRMLEIAISNTDRLGRLVNDILDLERMSSGRFAFDYRRVEDLSALMTSAAAGMQGAAAAAGIRLSVAPVAAPPVSVDPDRIVQALTNLLGNAVKFSPRGGRVTLDAEVRGRSVVMRVRDEGRGIPPEQLEQIFQRFQQVDASDAREKGGTGLGLPIARSIVEQHGGRLWADSAPGVGSTFYLELPSAEPDVALRAPVEVLLWGATGQPSAVRRALEGRGYRAVPVCTEADVAAALAGSAPGALVVDLGAEDLVDLGVLAQAAAAAERAGIPLVSVGELCEGGDGATCRLAEATLGPLHARRHPGSEAARVLIVEDDADVATVLSAQLSRRGLHTFSAATELEAVALAIEVVPDVIVLDLALVEGDGFGVIRSLREQERLAHTSVVVYTVRELDAEDYDRLRAGHTTFLVKGRATPADVDEHIAALLGLVTSPGGVPS